MSGEVEADQQPQPEAVPELQPEPESELPSRALVDQKSSFEGTLAKQFASGKCNLQATKRAREGVAVAEEAQTLPPSTIHSDAAMQPRGHACCLGYLWPIWQCASGLAENISTCNERVGCLQRLFMSMISELVQGIT